MSGGGKNHRTEMDPMSGEFDMSHMKNLRHALEKVTDKKNYKYIVLTRRVKYTLKCTWSYDHDRLR